LGIKIKDAKDLASNFEVDSISRTTFNENWKPVLGEQAIINNHYNQLQVNLKQSKTDRTINLVFRVFDEGVAFRYVFPLQKN